MREFFKKVFSTGNFGAILGGLILLASLVGIAQDWSKPAPIILQGTQLTLSETVDSEHYTADTCIVCCIDDRFTHILNHFAKNSGYSKVDWIKVAGGAKDFEFDSEPHAYLRKQIVKSLELHHTKRVDIVVHMDCGAYGADKTSGFYIAELKKIKPEIELTLSENGYHVPVTAYFAKFDGLYEVK